MTDTDQGDPHDAAPSPLTSLTMPVPPSEQHGPATPFGIGVWVVLAIFVVAVIRRLLSHHK